MAHRFKEGVLFFVPVVHRGAAQRLEDFRARLARDRPHRDRGIGRAEGGGADLRDVHVQRMRKGRQAVDV